jgi:hypothetical protein
MKTLDIAQVLALSAALALAGCDEKSRPRSEPLTPPSAAPKLDEVPRPAPGSTETTLSGKILEKLSVPSYSYLHLDTGSDKVWVAVPTATVAVGDRVTVERAMLMSGFRSTALKRDFDRVYFGTLGGAPGHAPTAAHGTPAPSAALPVVPDKLAKASGPNARTVQEVITQAKTLQGRTASVRGVVVKTNSGILGKTWIHLRDGSGAEADKTHDLTATLPANETPKLGETVVVHGSVATNRDVGGGYLFPVLLEGTRLERESP